jgi:hypothetical protein
MAATIPATVPPMMAGRWALPSLPLAETIPLPEELAGAEAWLVVKTPDSGELEAPVVPLTQASPHVLLWAC